MIYDFGTVAMPWLLALIALIPFGVGLMLWVRPELLKQKSSKPLSRRGQLFFGAWCLAISGLVLWLVLSEYFYLRRFYEAEHYQVVEGTLHNYSNVEFKPGVNHIRFSIASTGFAYSTGDASYDSWKIYNQLEPGQRYWAAYVMLRDKPFILKLKKMPGGS